MTGLHRLPILVAALAVAAADVAPARAQCDGCPPPSPRAEALSLVGNSLIGGVTAAVHARLQRRPVAKAFVAGAAGGALTFAGKRIAVERGDGAGLAGREVAAIGTSLTANVAEGRGMMDRLVLPVGPVRMYLQARGPGPALALRLDAAAVVAAAYAATVPGSSFDARESLSAGALVFRVDRPIGEVDYDGRHVAGVILVRAGSGEDSVRMDRAAAHERVHAIQYDQSFVLWTAPAEARLMDGAGWSRSLHRWVDLGLNAPVLAGLGAVIPYNVQPWEAEARFLSRAPRVPEQ
jgi:hypothetical protein